METWKILVVGGAGFIGSHVNKMLNLAGYETVVFDNLSRGDARAVRSGAFVEGDLSDEEQLSSLFEKHKFLAVMHFAAFTDVGESVSRPGLYYRNNVTNTLNLLDCMIKHGVKKIIFSSSAAVYGTPVSAFISETTPCQPINPYGMSKYVVELILQDFEKAYGLKFCILRYFNAAGGDPDREIKNFKQRENNLIPLALRSLLEPKGKITIFGSDYPTEDGTCIRDYVHVMDIASAHIAAMVRLVAGSASAIYNLGNGNGYSVKAVLQAVQNVTGLTLNVLQGPRREGDPAVLVANAEKAHRELAWQPRYPALEPMIDHAWKALQEERSRCVL